ncbi:hypothetical protein [Terribacillus saccharophilus]|uniref:hypothetical protein n=1 Tax=Terribacillus saccharophilus TaxID=361277 RepID=UPI003D29FE5A
MLSDKDIEFMKQADADIRINRTHSVLIGWTTELPGEKDSWTGEPTEVTEQDVTVAVDAVVTEITTEEHALESGIEVEEGDIIVDVRYEDLPIKANDIEKVTYDGEEYTIIGADRRGIGAFVRVEMVGRLTNGQG